QGRRITATNPDSRVTTTGYDPAGHVTSVKDPAGAVTTDTVDPAGQLTAISYSDGVTPNITAISYDADGRRTAMTDGTGTSSWSYDTFGEVTASVNGAATTVGYTYDSRGDQTSITYPDAKIVIDGYDQDGQLTSVKDAASATTTLGYTADGQNSTISYPNGTKVTNGFNAGDQQTSTTLTSGASTLGAISYGRDNANQVATRTPSGSIPGTTQAYTYTALEQVKTDSTGSFSYDGANNPIGLTGTTQKFDAAAQLCWSTPTAVTGSPTCATPPTGATTYSFNTDGERTASTPSTGTASTFSYNQAQQLTAASTPSGAGTYTYDGTGLRTSKTVGGSHTSYTWGLQGSNNVLLSDGTNDYLYGAAGLLIEQTSATATSYLVHDQVGSTVALTGAAGTIVGTYSYSTYGKTLSHTGSVSSPFQFGQGLTDAETGLIYLQHRYYDPSTAQFITVDPALASTGMPYSYVNDNPQNGTDHTGLWFGIDDLVASGVGALVGAGTSIVEQAVSGDVNWSKVGIAAGAGAVGGEAALYCGPFCGGAIASGLTEAGTELYDTGSVNWQHVALSAGIGGIFGKLGDGLLGDMGDGVHFEDGEGDPGLGSQFGVGFGTTASGDYTSMGIWAATGGDGEQSAPRTYNAYGLGSQGC
ncbi:MAG: RHS repeat-associated core domain-containing protein, partial [Jatrophihabitantaceae bacterium]